MSNLADHLFRRGRTHGAKTALFFEGETYSYAALVEQVRETAAGLHAAGVGVGVHVGLMMSARPAFIIFQQALFALGAVVCPLNIFYRRNELIHAIASCDLVHLVVGSECIDALPEPGAAGTETLKTIFLRGAPTKPDEARHTDPRIVCADALAVPGRRIDTTVQIAATSVGLILNTSATTGKAKGVMLSIANVQANYDPTPTWLGLDHDTVTLCALPLYNTFGLNQCINAMMVTGASMALMPRFDALKCLQAIQTYRCTFFPAVPTMLQKLFDHPDAGRYDLRSITRIMTGAAPVSAALLERIHAVMGPDTVVMTGYGLTEACAIVSLDYVHINADGKVARPKSIGKVLPGMQVRILAEDGSICGPDQIGEICVRGPNVMLGYYKMPDDTAMALADGWLHTGDLGFFDAQGYGIIVDRKKDVIIRGGQNIYPIDIEEVIHHIPGVSEVAVIGKADAVLGEVPIAYVALRPDAAVSSATILARCKRELAHYKVPTEVHVLPELPKGPTGKILRRGLQPP